MPEGWMGSLEYCNFIGQLQVYYFTLKAQLDHNNNGLGVKSVYYNNYIGELL